MSVTGMGWENCNWNLWMRHLATCWSKATQLLFFFLIIAIFSFSPFLNNNFYWNIVAFSSKRICLPRRRHVEDLGSTPGLGRFQRRNGNPLQYSRLEHSWTEEPGGLWFMGSKRVGHDWVTHKHTHIVALQSRVPTDSCSPNFMVQVKDRNTIPVE